jgi:hypothetical protein
LIAILPEEHQVFALFSTQISHLRRDSASTGELFPHFPRIGRIRGG